MSTAVSLPHVRTDIAPTVLSCYDVLHLALGCGITDFTDGKYVDDSNDRQSYLAAQRRQAEYLLDQIDCGPGTRLLDVGCGYGRVLKAAAARGAQAVGITIAPSQIKYCRDRGLTVHELNYRDIFRGGHPDWEGTFDGIVANGSLEHFAQAEDALDGRDDEIYEEMFAICRRLTHDGGKIITTAIHCRDKGQVPPELALADPATLSKGSEFYHAAVLHRSFGGWFPYPGQLKQCAAPYFALIEEEDGTHDYYLTSEYWLRRIRRTVMCHPRAWWSVGRSWWKSPEATYHMLRCLLWDQSWNRQFRPPALARLFRHTWLAK